MLLENRRALVTGASSGIGRATAVRFAREGAAVAVNYVGAAAEADADAVVAEITAAGGTAMAVAADVGDEGQVKAMVEAVVARLGGVDILVNNAGIEHEVPTLDMELDQWERVLRVNLTGAFLCMREVARRMVAAGGGGVVVNMSSVHEHIPWPGFADYCASKGGLRMLTQTVAREWAEHRIRVLAIAPGAISTPINSGVLADPTQRHAVEAEIPLGRFGTAEEIAAAVAWACSDEAAYVTGTTIVVDGGMTLYPRFV